MRRKIIHEPVSRSAIWSRRLAWMGIAVTLIAVFLTRSGRIEHEAGLVAITSGLAFGALALLLALAAFVRIWHEGRRGLGSALGGFVLAILLLAFPAYLGAREVHTPQARDVSTDLDDPPQFSRSPTAIVARSGWIGGAFSPRERTAFRRAYPGLSPVILDLPLEDAHALALLAAQERGLSVIEWAPPGDDGAASRIEARTLTWVLRLPVEVTIRVAPFGDGARIDARAASPAGNHDIGGNLAVLRGYLAEVAFLYENR
jgi:hypothetical protein